MKNFSKMISVFTALILIVTCISSCSDRNSGTDTVRVTALKGPTGIGMVKLMSDNDQNKTDNKYEFTLATSPDEITAEVIRGDFDIAAVPANLASVLYSKTKGEIQIAAINTLGVLYIIETGDSIQTVNDLNGKTIYATAQGSTPEYVLNYILACNNITANVEYYTEHAELATLMASNTEGINIGMLPEPNVTAVLKGNSEARIALNLTDEWNSAAAINGDTGALVQGCIIVSKKFAAENKDALDKFLEEYKASVEYVNSNVSEAAGLTVEYGIIGNAGIAEAAIPNCNITFIVGNDMKTKLNGFFNVLLNANPTSIGGAVPNDDIYYVK